VKHSELYGVDKMDGTGGTEQTELLHIYWWDSKLTEAKEVRQTRFEDGIGI
jgi:hypothetical protein